MRPFGGGLPVPLFRRRRRSRPGRGVAFLLDFPSPHPSPARSSQGEGDRRAAFQCLIRWQVLRTGPTNGHNSEGHGWRRAVEGLEAL